MKTTRPQKYKNYSGTDYYRVNLPRDFTEKFEELQKKTLEINHSGAQITFTVTT